jgi:hypothetical protein
VAPDVLIPAHESKRIDASKVQWCGRVWQIIEDHTNYITVARQPLPEPAPYRIDFNTGQYQKGG